MFENTVGWVLLAGFVLSLIFALGDNEGNRLPAALVAFACAFSLAWVVG